MGCASSKQSDPWAAAAAGNLGALSQWLDSGGRADAPHKEHGLLLHAAARRDQVECIKLLLKCGVPVDAATPEHGTALHAAAAAGCGNAVTLLLANGASASARLRGATPAELAQQRGFPATANLIRMSLVEAATGGGRGAEGAADRAAASAGNSRSSEGGSASASAAAARQRQLAVERLRAVQKQLSAADAEWKSNTPAAIERRAKSDPVELASAPAGGMPHAASAAAREQRQTSRQALAAQQEAAKGARAAQRQAAVEQRRADSLERRRALGEQLNPLAPGGPGPAELTAAAQRDLQQLEQQQLEQQQQQQPPPGSIASNGPVQASGASAPSPPTAEPAGGTAAQAPPAEQLPAAGERHQQPGGGSFGQLAQAAAPSLPWDASDPQLQHASDGSRDGSEGAGANPRSIADCGETISAISLSSSAAPSLEDDPLLKFVREALRSRPPDAVLNSAAAQATALAAQPGTVGQPPGGAAPANGAGGSAVGAAGSRQRQASCSLVDIRPWEIKFGDLQLQRLIGEGSYGKVFVAKWHETLVAVKVLLDLEEAQKTAGPEAAWTLSNPILINLQKECGLMASLRHPNIVQFMGVSAFPPAMVTEYCGRGSLADVLRAARASPAKLAHLTWMRRLAMALDATKGLLYLHRKNIVHRDLKSPNLLVESTWKVKVGDFNLSKIIEDKGSGRSTAANMNPRWLAPEILNGEPATPASDVFSWGVVMWEMLTLQTPWPHASHWMLVGKLVEGQRLEVPPRDKLPGPDTDRFAGLDDYIILMRRCWAQRPAERPCFEEVIRQLRKMLEQLAK